MTINRCTGRNSSTAGSALTKLAPISCAELLVHVHIADSDRQPPGLGGYNLTGFLRHLRVSGYDGDCSIECRWLDFCGQIGASLRYVREAAQAAGW